MRQISACVQCGSKDIRQSRLDDGIVPGATELSAWVCNRCGHQGMPLLFDSEENRASFEAAQTESSDAQR